jgi:hypothetical protein
MNTAAPATLATSDRGITTRFHNVRPGAYVWHRGAYRLVTSNDGWTIRMGRYASKCGVHSYEVAA